MDDKFLIFFIIGGSRFHFHCIVSEPQFGQGEAPDGREVVDALDHGHVALGAQEDHAASEEVVLHGQFGGKATVHEAGHFVVGEDVEGVLLEVEH